MDPRTVSLYDMPYARLADYGVTYGNNRVSDPILRSTLAQISYRLGSRLFITSGDRNGAVNGNKRSHHLYGRAADFYVEGTDLRNTYAKIKNMEFVQRGYQLIYHTEDTISPHLHLGRYLDGRKSSFIVDDGFILPMR